MHDAGQRMDAIRKEAQAWVVRLDSRRATTDDAQAFRRWCAQGREHARAFSQAREVWQGMRPAARRVEHSLRETRASEVRPARRAFLGAALAASVGYLVVRPPLQLWPSLTELRADYRTGVGEQREVRIDGGLVVQMNTRTRINGMAADAGVAGLELLDGEAEFQAAVSALRVVAGGGTISARRARFNVRQSGEEICVSCLAGQVDVRKGGVVAALEAGSQLVYGPGGLGAPRRSDAAAVSAWRQRLLVFNQAPLSEVVNEVNRYRPGRLILLSEAIGRSRVQASFAIDRLDDVVALVRDVYGLQVTQLPGGIVLLGAPEA